MDFIPTCFTYDLPGCCRAESAVCIAPAAQRRAPHACPCVPSLLRVCRWKTYNTYSIAILSHCLGPKRK